jgi:WD40 repeat protein
MLTLSWSGFWIAFECVANALLQAIRAIEMPQGASQLYTGSQDESVRVWDCTTGQASQSLLLTNQSVCIGGFS